jgi:hypothetical protein
MGTRKTCVFGAVLSLLLGIAAVGIGADTAENRTKVFGVINSLEPCGAEVGAPKTLKFTAYTSFSGVNGETHTITLKLAVLDADAKVVSTASKAWTVTSGEQGCIKCPVTCKSPNCLEAGAYFINASLTDQKASEATILLDAKTCVVSLSE